MSFSDDLPARHASACSNPLKHRRGRPTPSKYSVEGTPFCRSCLADLIALQATPIRAAPNPTPRPVGACQNAHATHRAAVANLDSVPLCWACIDARLIDRDRWKGPDHDPYHLSRLERPKRPAAADPGAFLK